jgi:hypothetical protein
MDRNRNSAEKQGHRAGMSTIDLKQTTGSITS